MTKTKAYRPGGYSKKYLLRANRTGEPVSHYKWHTRMHYGVDTLPPNRATIARIFAQLHYLGSHSPNAISKKWRPVERQFYKRYFGDTARQSGRFANKYTAHSWL